MAIDVKMYLGWREHKEPIKTNADHIRAMTDEELAMCLKDLTCPFRYGGKVICDIDNKGCHQCWLDWLKQEATE